MRKTSKKEAIFGRKSEITVKEGTLMAYKQIHNKFSMGQLTKIVAGIIGRPLLEHTSVGRKLRLLRKQGVIDYTYVSGEGYHKAKLPNEY